MNIESLQIETPRLWLRPPRLDDFDAYAVFAADPEASRHLGGTAPRSTAWRGFLALVGAWHLQGFSMFSVICKASGEWIGRVGPWMPDGWPGTEVGWSIVRSRWRQGYAEEAATAAIDWAFANLGWRDVIHVIDTDNIPSQALARKLGARNRGRGRLPAPYEDAEVSIWGQTREAWLARRSG